MANESDLLSVFLESGRFDDARLICKNIGFKNPDLWRRAISFWASRIEDKEVISQLKQALPIGKGAKFKTFFYFFLLCN